MKIDLHCHTTASDGIYTPENLIDHAVKNEVSTLAITDHDTINGIAHALKYAEDKDIEIIAGIEFSVAHERGAFHLLGMFVDYNYEPLCSEVELLQESRDKRIYHILESLHKSGVKINIEDVMREADGGAVGKPHVARVMIKNGYGKSVDDIFAKYLADGKPGDVPKKRISEDRAIELILQSGGIPIVAHPASLEYTDNEKFEKFLVKLIEKGVKGIEAYSSMHDEELVAYYLNIAKKYNLLVSGGSDFHGDKGEIIGYYAKGKVIPDNILEKIYNMHKEKA
jgi:predicted metal-dependent phosphoesterase TrpH